MGISRRPPVTRICKECKNSFKVQYCFRKKKFCKQACYIAYMKKHPTTKGMKFLTPAHNRVLSDRPLTRKEIDSRYYSAEQEKRTKLPKIKCACGCGKFIPQINSQNKPAKYAWGHNPSPELDRTGKPAWNKGVFGSVNSAYMHGHGYEPYPNEFNLSFKESIRKRDNHICQKCDKIWTSGIKHHIHHIDYNKKNCDSMNLITLCNSCNIKANFNRAHWQAHFTALMHSRFP